MNVSRISQILFLFLDIFVFLRVCLLFSIYVALFHPLISFRYFRKEVSIIPFHRWEKVKHREGSDVTKEIKYLFPESKSSELIAY